MLIFDWWQESVSIEKVLYVADNFDGELTCVWFLDHVQKIPPTLCWLIVDPRLPEVSPTCGSLSTGATSPVKSSGTLRTWKMFGVTSMLRQVRPLTQFFFCCCCKINLWLACRANQWPLIRENIVTFCSFYQLPPNSLVPLKWLQPRLIRCIWKWGKCPRTPLGTTGASP